MEEVLTRRFKRWQAAQEQQQVGGPGTKVDPSFALLPDLLIVDGGKGQLGRAVGVPLPSVALAHEMLTAARGLGLAQYDFAVMFDALAAMCGLAGSPKPPAGPGS